MLAWARALENLRLERKVSKNRLHENKVMSRSQYNTMLKAKKGPRIDVLHRVLRGLGVGWKEWADAYETILSDTIGSVPYTKKNLSSRRKVSA